MIVIMLAICFCEVALPLKSKTSQGEIHVHATDRKPQPLNNSPRGNELPPTNTAGDISSSTPLAETPGATVCNGLGLGAYDAIVVINRGSSGSGSPTALVSRKHAAVRLQRQLIP